LYTSRSATAGHFQSTLGLRGKETIIPVSQRKAQLPAMTVEYLTENCDIVEKERSKWAEFNVTSKISPKADAEAKRSRFG
jgi:hypothetical protein